MGIITCTSSSFVVDNSHIYEGTIFDIIHLDTGNKNDYSDRILFYPHTNVVYGTHGTAMIRSFKDQLHVLNLEGITGLQIVVPFSGNPLIIKNYIAALKLAAFLHPKVISISAGNADVIPEERAVISKLHQENILFLAASGNEGKADFTNYPAGYQFKCVLSVGTKKGAVRIDYSNKADMYLEENFFEAGTSFSTARAGAVALKYMKDHPKDNCEQIRERLVNDYKL
jgi:subtilisin family serine protease